MFAHGYLMFPDYIAIGMLIGNLAFLISLTIYAIRNVSDRSLSKQLAELVIYRKRKSIKNPNFYLYAKY